MESRGYGPDLCSFSQNCRISTSLQLQSRLNMAPCKHLITNRLCGHLFLRSQVPSNRPCAISVPRIASLHASGTTVWHVSIVDVRALDLRFKSSRFCEYGLNLAHEKSLSISPRLDQRSTARGSSFVCRGSGHGSTEQSLPEEDSDEVQDPSTPADAREADWRAFRARLVAGEQELSSSPEPDGMSEAVVGSASSMLGKSWAHPLLVPEAGCVLVATEKLDGEIDFERTVVLLLRIGSSKPREGPFGIVLNRPILQSINELNPINRAVANIFGNCQPFHGGPLKSADLFLLMGELEGNKQFEEVVPGIYYGGSSELQHAAELVKDGVALLHDIRFYAGYVGWDLDQLMNEIETGSWHVAACSLDLIRATSSEHLWQEILLLMGGLYAVLARKPKEIQGGND